MVTQLDSNKRILRKVVKGIFTLLLFCVLIYFGEDKFSIDFWYDEVLSLEEFILVPFEKTVTDYQVPNNHIFFNLLMNTWLKIWGIETFAQAADNVFIVRLLPLIFFFVTLVIIGAIEEKITQKKENNISIFVLVGIIPFYNTVAQIRGYGLSILLFSALVYFAYIFYQKPSKTKGAVITLFTALLLYTIPSNLYAVLSALLVLGIIFLGQWYKYHFLIALRFNAAKLMLWLLLGIGVGVLLYILVGKQVINNEYVKSEGFFRWEIWGEAQQFFQYTFLPYYVVPILIFLGIVIAIIKKVDVRLILVFSVMAVLPFVFSFIRVGTPFDRTFLWICPFIALVAALFADILYKHWIKNTMLGNANTFAMLGLVIMVLGISAMESDVKTTLSNGLEKGVKHQNVYYNYYLGSFNPNKNLGLLKEKYYREGTQVFMHEVDKRAMPAYLSVHGLKWQPYKDTIAKIDEYYIVTAFEQQAIEEYKQVDSTFTFKRLNEEPDFVNIIQAKRTE